ncbi:Protein-glutamate methylesterase/protein-glutamine glutaminase [Halomonadaceae bacterium LMG 33818]|uniref:response regulator n=1 Tax=Cernens ardua TaxID=3402176 RepID=UPI003EDBB3DC
MTSLDYPQRQDVVLVVDDSPDSLGMIHQALEQAGITTLVALDGEQGIQIATRMVPDLILLDALMPTLDGFETCRQLKARPDVAGIPVIFMTGLSETEHVVKGFDSGAEDYVTKPIHPAELIARIRVHLRNTHEARATRRALDYLGQSSFSMNEAGEWAWVSSQIGQWREAYGDAAETIPGIVTQWLKQTPLPGDLQRLGIGPWRLRFLGLMEEAYLFRLTADDGETEADLLKEMLRLTQRESHVLLWIAQGKTNREIAQILELSPRTVNKHLEQIYRKIGVENRTQAAAMALRCLTRL